MFPDQSQRDNLTGPEIREDVSREDIVAAFRVAMVGHFRSHIPGTNINESTLLATDYLNHFHELVMMLEAVVADGHEFAQDMLLGAPSPMKSISRNPASATKTSLLPPTAARRPRSARGLTMRWRGCMARR